MVFRRKEAATAPAKPAARPAAAAAKKTGASPTKPTGKPLPIGKIPGTMYWGCESTFHKLCLEADQRPTKRPWGAVADYCKRMPEQAAKAAVKREGSLKLTPLAIVCQEAPPPVVKIVMDIAPAAIRIGDKYGAHPIHRVALQNRKPYAAVTLKLLRDADPSSLVHQDGWVRTPLICALESGRGVASPPCMSLLTGTKGEACMIPNKKKKTVLTLIKERTDVDIKEKRAIIKILQAHYKNEQWSV